MFRTMTKFNQKRLLESTVNTGAGARRENTAASELLCSRKSCFHGAGLKSNSFWVEDQSVASLVSRDLDPVCSFRAVPRLF